MDATTAAPATALNTFPSLPDDALVRPKTAAQLLGCCPATVKRLDRTGRLKKIKVGPRHVGYHAGNIREILSGVN